MKNISILISGLLLCSIGFTACDKDQEIPPVAYPDYGSREDIHSGTWDDPFSVWQVRAGTIGNGVDGEAWVTGYIVGYINTEDGDYSKLRERSAKFTAAGAPNSNLLLANTPDETDWEKCIPVKLLYGTSSRDLSLQQHPNYLHRQVSIYGITGDKYLSIYGIQNATTYNWGDKGVGMGTFVLTNSINDGDQCLLVADGQYVAQPVSSDRDYGYLYVSNSDGGNSIASETTNAFTFNRDGDYWTIQDANGRYLYMSGSSNSFDVKAEKPASNYLWSIEFQENGTALIKNVGNGNWIQYSQQHNSYGCYPDSRGLLPAFYVLESVE